jgi:hypothetical protein
MRDPRETVATAIAAVDELLSGQGFRRRSSRGKTYVRREGDRISEIDLAFEYRPRDRAGTFQPTVFTAYKSLERVLRGLPPEIAVPHRPAYGLAGDIAKLPPRESFAWQIVDEQTESAEITDWLAPRLNGPVKSFLDDCGDPVRLVRVLGDRVHPFYSDSRTIAEAVLRLEVCGDRSGAREAAEHAVAMAQAYRRGARRPVDVERGNHDLQCAVALLKYVASADDPQSARTAHGVR